MHKSTPGESGPILCQTCSEVVHYQSVSGEIKDFGLTAMYGNY
ncbi:MAG TPA: hypothetical protein P5221_09005 [Bacteroidia bacterium]|nr:hypothetical protein [Bacteroidia bacterium]